MKPDQLMTGVLRPDVELIRGDSTLLFDRQKDVYYKIDGRALKIVSYLTESMPVDVFLENLHRNGICIERKELIGLLAFLRQNDLLLPQPGEMAEKKKMQEEFRKKHWLLRFSSAYLFFRLPPWRPERFFEKAGPLIGWLADRKTVAVYILVALAGYLLLIRDFSSAVTEFRNTLSWVGLVKYFFAVIAVKCIHEFAHALAAVHFHCRVRGIGIGFMVFCPRLYTDTTDSWRLPRKERLLIDSAGILAEVFIGGAAALCWCFLPPGAFRSTMFYILTVSTLSTLVINANPFIRYDGYYIFCDLTGEDNLMSRSADAVRQYWLWYCLRLGKAPDLRATWKLVLFGVCSFLYRIFLYTSIILVIYHQFNQTLAVLMILLEIYAVLLYPFWREVKTVYCLSRQNRRKMVLPCAILLAMILLLLLFPLSRTEELPGEVSAKHRSIVAVPEAGFLTERIETREVRKNDAVCRLSSPRLQFSRERIEKKHREELLLLRYQRQDEKQYADAELTSARLRSIEEALQEVRRKTRLLTVRSPSDGTFVPVSRDLYAGKYLPRNSVLGHVCSGEKLVIAYANDQQLGHLAAGQNAEILLRGTLRILRGRVRSVSPVPAVLEESALLQPFGGMIPVHERKNPNQPIRPVHTLYRVEVEGDDPGEQPILSGQVVKVRVQRIERLGSRIVRMILSVWRNEQSLW